MSTTSLRKDILNPIAADSPSGPSLLYEQVFTDVKEARREKEAVVSGDWAEPGKVADYRMVILLCEEALATKTKDLQLAAWLADALLKENGFGGLSEGLALCKDLIEKFWDTLHPLPDEDGLNFRAGALRSLAKKMETDVKMRPLSGAGHSFFVYKQANSRDYEKSNNPADKAKLKEKIDAARDDFEKAFTQTPKVFYLELEKELDQCRAGVKALSAVCDPKFGDDGPGFSTFLEALNDVRHTVHVLLERKRETEPDPPEVDENAQPADDGSTPEPGASKKVPAGISAIVIPFASTEPPDRRAAIVAIATQAAFLRKQKPYSPAPYLMMRGLRWGEVRDAAAASDPSWLEAPPMELRQLIKTQALAGKWSELLETAENAMSLPCSRAWLDLQRFVVEACVALGPEYHAIATAIQNQLRLLIDDVPQILDVTLMDDTPTANAQTRVWLAGLVHGAPRATTAATPEEPLQTPAPVAPQPVSQNGGSGWRYNLRDSYIMAQESLAAGQHAKAVSILQAAVEQERSGRGRFQRTMQLVEICADAKRPEVAQPFIEDLEKALVDHKLESWENSDTVIKALMLIMKYSKRGQDASEKAKLFERICRLDPAKALEFPV